MDYRALKAFLIVSDTKHFGKASTLCDLTTSALSRMIQRMEKELDVMLFERKNKELRITPHGKKFYDYATDTLSKWEQIQKDLAPVYPDQIDGEVRICVSSSMPCERLLGGMLRPFQSTYKNVDIFINELSEDKSDDVIKDGTMDFQLSAVRDAPLSEFIRKIIAKSELVVVMPKAWGTPKDAKDLENYPIALSRWEGVVPKYNKFFKKHGIKPNVGAYIDSTHSALVCVEKGMFGAIVPRRNIEHWGGEDTFHVIENIDVGEEIKYGIIGRKGGYHSPAWYAFWKMIHESDLYPADELDSGVDI